MSEIEGGELAGPVEPGRPDWLPAQFQNGEAFVKSYHEAQGRISQLSEKQQEIEETLNAVLDAQEQEPPQAPARAQVDHLDLLRMLADRASQQAVSQIPAQGPFNIAATSHANRVADLVAADPELRGIDIANLIGQVPDEALSTPEATVSTLKGLAHSTQLNQLHSAVTNAKQIESQLNRQMKLQAQSASGAAGRPTPGEDDADYGRSLIAAHNESYAARMARVN
jgi:hypothetical protein